MFPDHNIIARAGAHEILADRQEVMFPHDGSAIWLHQVRRAGVPQPMLRAAACDRGALWLFDLGRIHPPLDVDLRVLPERDRIGLVFHGLRQAFPTKSLFLKSLASRVLAILVVDTTVAA